MWRDPSPSAPPNGRHVPEPRVSEFEQRLIGYGLATTAAAGLLVWLSGQLAGLLFGHTWMHLTVGDVAAILWRLPSTLGDPKLAWPAEVRRALPGPVGLYFSAALLVGGIAGAITMVVRLATQYLPGRAPGHRPGREHTRRHRRGSVWASGRELRLLYVRRPTPGRVIVGRTSRLAGLGKGGRLLASEDCHSVLIFGPGVIFSRAEARPVDQQRCVVDEVLDAAWGGYVEGWSGDAGVIELMPSSRAKGADSHRGRSRLTSVMSSTALTRAPSAAGC